MKAGSFLRRLRRGCARAPNGWDMPQWVRAGKAPGAVYLSGSLRSELAGHVAELVDALDLGSSGATRQSSSLCLPTHPRLDRPGARK